MLVEDATTVREAKIGGGGGESQVITLNLEIPRRYSIVYLLIFLIFLNPLVMKTFFPFEKIRSIIADSFCKGKRHRNQ